MKTSHFLTVLALSAFAAFSSAVAEDALRLPSIIGDNMVLQRDQENRIWGWDKPGANVTVKIAGQEAKGKADAKGRWEVKLKPMGLQTNPLRMEIIGSEWKPKILTNILVGEVWVCSGQSNMQWSVSASFDADIEKLTAKFPNIRLITVPRVGTQEIQDDFVGQWEACTPESVGAFSAVGYFFGRELHQVLDVPVGLINNAWGGSAAEAWVKRDVLQKDARFKDYMDQWAATEKDYDYEKVLAAWQVKYVAWKAKAEKLKAEGKSAGNAPRKPTNAMTGQHRPGNLYAGVLHPIIGYGIRGSIWYQGETNAGRAKNYADLFPLMITHWRKEWGQGDFPFYWVQLADYQAEVEEPGDSTWAELRESQTKTLSLPNTGQAVIYDIGEGRDIHPRDKQTVARRLARIAFAKDYGIDVPYQGPSYKSMAVKGDKAVLKFDNVGNGLYSFDVTTPKGFAIAGADKVWHWADAKITGKDAIEVSSKSVKVPVAVRYAWAHNPVATVESKAESLPLDPFRTDDWKMITDPTPDPEPAKPEPAKPAAAPKPAASKPAAAKAPAGKG